MGRTSINTILPSRPEERVGNQEFSICRSDGNISKRAKPTYADVTRVNTSTDREMSDDGNRRKSVNESSKLIRLS